jgi:hypothetical protein
MGYSPSYSDNEYRARQANLQSAGKSAFDYHDRVIQNTPSHQRKVHADLDPKGVKFRESRDSDAHPESRAIAVFFDETGSMAHTPRVAQQKLPQLMAMLLSKGYVTDPQILFGAFGDAFTDRAPLQVGQFESGVEMDEVLEKFFLEENGGGQVHESSELVLHFMAEHTSIDCLEKRGVPGYLFLVTDEMPYAHVEPTQLEKVIGDKVTGRIPIEEVAAKVAEKYEVFVLLRPYGGGGRQAEDREIRAAWQRLFPQRVVDLPDDSLICETIASTIGINEGIVDVDGAMRDLQDVGAGAGTAVISRALSTVTRRTGLRTSGSATGELIKPGDRGVEEL